jgi:hypothetical protein
MNNMSDISLASHTNALSRELSLDSVRSRTPAVFATAHERMSHKYTFIPTERVLGGPINVGRSMHAKLTRGRRVRCTRDTS